MTDQITLTSGDKQARAGKYLTFVLDDEEYGLEILKVREIIGMMQITAVPRTPNYVKGVINLRGKVIPVVDLRLKVGMPEAERTDETCTIVVDIGDIEMGIIVDKVSEVLNIAGKDIEDAPSFGAQVNIDFIRGIGKADEKVTILLDISKLLSQSDVVGMDLSAVSPQGGVSEELMTEENPQPSSPGSSGDEHEAQEERETEEPEKEEASQ